MTRRPTTPAAPAPSSTFDRVVRLASQVIGAPVSLISLVGPEKQVFVSALGLDEPWATQMETPLTHSLCQHVVANDAPLRLEDARTHPEHCTSLAIPELGVVSYLGVPLRTRSNTPLGALCVIGHEPREWSDADVAILEDLSGIATTEIDRQRMHADLLRASHELAQQGETIRAFFDTAPLMMGVVELLHDDILHRLDNSATATYFGSTPEAMRGQRSSDLGTAPETVARWLAAYREAIETGAPVQFDVATRGSTGSQILATTVSSIGASPDGRPLCLYVCEDVTARRATEAALQRSQQDLQSALAAGKMSTWKVDLPDGVFSFPDEMRRLCHIDRDRYASRDALLLVHEDDRQRVKDAYKSAISATVASGEAREVTFEYRAHVRGETRWFRNVGRVEPGGPDTAHAMTGTIADITDEKQYQHALEDARERAQEAARAAAATTRLQTSILHNMSHEIRTPLTAVIGYADLLAEDASGDASEYVGCIRDASGQLLTTLNSVLDHARLEAGHGTTKEGDAIENTRLDVAPIVGATAQLFRHRAADTGVSLLWTPPEAPVWALADRGAIQRVLANLVSNAVKFTPAGSITLSVEQAPHTGDSAGASGEVAITIRDTGIGMSEAFVARAFEPFEQESDGMSRSHEGTGLGLAIVRQLVEMMEGSITLTSEPGVGTTFVVRIPAA